MVAFGMDIHASAATAFRKPIAITGKRKSNGIWSEIKR
jgi:hypothetical protein